MRFRVFLTIALLASQISWASENDDVRLQSAMEVVTRISEELDAAPPVGGNSEYFDPLESTRKVLAILRSMDYLAPMGEGDSTTTIRSEADVRLVPNKKEDRFAVAAKGARGRVLQVNDHWIRLAFDNGATGWVERSHTGFESDAPSDAKLQGRNRFLRAALGSRGVPYVWGGASYRGFDCSGLIMDVARKFGIRLPRTAAQQWEQGFPVDRKSLRPGDLVFFANTYKPGISHVGVYIEDNKFVHASSGKGKVTVSSLLEPYFSEKYAGARRLNLPAID